MGFFPQGYGSGQYKQPQQPQPQTNPFSWGSALGMTNSPYSQLSTPPNFSMTQGPVQGTYVTPSPISIREVWNPQQVQERVNQMKAGGAATVENMNKNIREQYAGQGFGVNSPIAAWLQTQNQIMNMGQQTGAENDLRWNSALGNAQHLLETEKAAASTGSQWLGSWLDYYLKNKALELEQQKFNASIDPNLQSRLVQSQGTPLQFSQQPPVPMHYWAGMWRTEPNPVMGPL